MPIYAYCILERAKKKNKTKKPLEIYIVYRVYIEKKKNAANFLQLIYNIKSIYRYTRTVRRLI